MNFRHQHSGELHRHVAFNQKFPPTPILRGTPSQYKRRNSGSASVLSQYASGCTTSTSKHSHRFQSTGAPFIVLPVVVQHKVPTIQTVQKSGEVSQCQHLDRYRRARRVAETGVATNQKIQRTVDRTQVRVHRDMYRSSRSSRRLLRHHKLSRENADHLEDTEDC